MEGGYPMSDIVILSGSPSELSGSEQVLKFLGSILERENFSVTLISVKDINPHVLITGDYKSPIVHQIADKLQEAKGVIVGSPVYKASYSGVLKALFDILPQDVLEDKIVLPVMTGGSPAHLLAIDYALKPLIGTVKGQSLKGLYFLDNQHIDKYQENPIIDEEILKRTKKQLTYFIEKIGIPVPVL